MNTIFGEPGKGIHSYRLFGVAIVDVIMTIVAAAIISKMFSISFLVVLVILFILGIVLHRLFDVKTTIDTAIFGEK